MPASRKRKPGRPARQVTADDLLLIRHPEQVERKNALIAHTALESLRRGDVTGRDWQLVAYRLNLGWLATAAPPHDEHRAVIDLAMDVMREIKGRSRGSDQIVARDSEVLTIGEALVLVDDLEHALTRRELLALSAQLKNPTK